MSASHLAIVPAPSAAPAVDSIGQRLRELRNEARALANEQVDQLRASLAETARLSAEISNGGEAYPVGVREVARRLMEDAAHQSMTLAAITERERNH